MQIMEVSHIENQREMWNVLGYENFMHGLI
jgi:hypothetical protein